MGSNVRLRTLSDANQHQNGRRGDRAHPQRWYLRRHWRGAAHAIKYGPQLPVNEYGRGPLTRCSAAKSSTLRRVHFHTPSENTIDGQRFTAMEGHYVFQIPGAPYAGTTNGLAVVGVLFDEGECNADLATFWELPPIDATGPGKQNVTGAAIQALVEASLLGGAFYQFTGSLTTPPCTRGRRVVSGQGALDGVQGAARAAEEQALRGGAGWRVDQQPQDAGAEFARRVADRELRMGASTMMSLRVVVPLARSCIFAWLRPCRVAGCACDRERRCNRRVCAWAVVLGRGQGRGLS